MQFLYLHFSCVFINATSYILFFVLIVSLHVACPMSFYHVTFIYDSFIYYTLNYEMKQIELTADNGIYEIHTKKMFISILLLSLIKGNLIPSSKQPLNLS